MKKKINLDALIGKKFYRLKVITFWKKVKKSKTYNYYYLCKCDCGNYTRTTRRSLLTGHTKSCGCLKKDCGKKIRKEFGANSKNSLYYQYKAGARQRNIKFNLTKKEFEKITQQSCHYCGQLPNHKYQAPKAYGYYKGNGIDRKNPFQGYNTKNCVACCKDCNYAKGKMNYRKFKKWIKKVYHRLHK